MLKNNFFKKFSALIIAGSLIFQPFVPHTALALNSQTVTANYSENSSNNFILGETYEGFKLMEKSFSNDFNANLYLFSHEKNGGKLVYIDSPDKNKWFSITFKTPAVDNSGVNHVLEHVVLFGGSEKYNIKSPFLEVGKRSVNTYLNAFTAPDYTSYPFASENEKDFNNLMKFYLDFSFSPLVLRDDMILKQEAWRYEIDDKDNISFNGIVFNEMKGAMSSKYRIFYQNMAKELYPNTNYIHNSGGNPENIVDLTHQKVISTHNKYYTPSNSCIMLYGKMNLTEKLKYINDQYYSKYDKTSAAVYSNFEKPFSAPKTLTADYPADFGASAEKDSILTISTAISNASQKDKLGLAILGNLLSGDEHSPLYKNIVEKKIGNDISIDFDDSFYQPSFTILLEGSSNKALATYETAVENTLQALVKNGIPKDSILGTLNKYELSFKNKLLTSNKGNSAMELVNTGFLINDNPLAKLNSSVELEAIKKEALESQYFEKLIQKYLIGNNHRLTLILEPNSNYMNEMDEAVDKKLQARINSMTPADISKIKSDAVKLKTWQATENTPEKLNALPSLKVEDLDISSKKTVIVEAKKDNINILKHPEQTLGLTKLSIYFDLKSLTESELEYLDLFKTVMRNSNTKNYTAEAFKRESDKYSSGINLFSATFDNPSDLKKCSPYLMIDVNFENANTSKVIALTKEKILHPILDDKDLIKSKLDELIEDIKSEKIDDPDALISSNLRSQFTAADAFFNIRYNKGFNTLNSANEDFEKAYPEILKNLNSIYKKVFTAENATISIVSENEYLQTTEYALPMLINDISSKPSSIQNWNLVSKKQNMGLIIPEEVQYINIGFLLNDIEKDLHGSDLVFANILNSKYMFENLREKAGAYGANLWILKDGSVIFTTYRDPNLKESIDTIKDIIPYLKNYKPTEQDIKNAIISVIANMEKEEDLFEKTFLEDSKKLSNFDFEAEAKLKAEILSTTAADLDQFIAKLEKGLENPSIVIAGSEKQIQNNSPIFQTIKNIND